ncbi:MAG: hypothetical protein KAX09_06805 [Candidatus Heimdallarchaeota archaeon]|nr:hypothetical protein [Candidatus Heimdallarchaeota archaeon]MCK4290677.1 hypothetical protein [Candidatus Heimdallarchaeota archaeon]
MEEEQVKKQIAFMENCASLNMDEIDSKSLDQTMEELYLALYELRKQINEIVVKLPLPLLTRFAKALQTLNDDQDNLTSDVQEELEMYFFYENIEEKIEENRELSWEELLDK